MILYREGQMPENFIALSKNNYISHQRESMKPDHKFARCLGSTD